jgi:type I restriction enzyme S subunit
MAEARTATLTREDRRQQFIESGWWVSIPFTTVPAHWVYQGENRLDGGYYTAEANAALRTVNDCGFEIQRLEKVTADIFVLDRFRRVYARDKESGWPYLSASEALDFRLTSDRYIAKDHAPRLAQLHFAQPGWLLVTASGTVGRMALVTERLSKYFLTHDLIRIVPNESPYGGYLYAYLSSTIGQALIGKDQYGSAIKHLEPHHLAGIPVPLLPEDIQAEIHAEIMRAYALRDEANALLDEADELLHEKLGLPRFNESLVPYLPLPQTPRLPANRPEMPHPKAFSIRASELNERLDVSYHIPVVRTITELLKKGRCDAVPLSELTRDIHIPPRFKRIYVSKGYGVPFLRPSHLPQMRPYDLGYISRLTKELDSLTLHLGDVLITTDGTVGRIGIVTSRMAGWAGSNNIARVTYGNNDFRNGFLAAFLSTPYGFYQLTREIYGGVVDHIEVPHIESVLVPTPPKDIQVSIGERVVKAFELKDEASVVEECAIRKVEEILQKGKAAYR